MKLLFIVSTTISSERDMQTPLAAYKPQRQQKHQQLHLRHNRIEQKYSNTFEVGKKTYEYISHNF